MCGLLGYIGLENQEPINIDIFTAMNDAMSHRGPDGEGFFFSGRHNGETVQKLRDRRPEAFINYREGGRTAGLAHRRLSIIDLSTAAAQPMCSYDGRIWVVFNGEIYNHKALRQELVAENYRFRTDHSDTEVILCAYQKWGAQFVHKLRGMFAIVIWDADNDKLLLFRDRTGIKPLYYTISNGRFYFASEIKAMLADRSIKRKLSEEGLYHYLSFLTVPAPQTLFADIFKLPAGYCLEINGGVVGQMSQYWDVFDNVVSLTGHSEEDICTELLSKLRDSVSSHLESDVPVGVFLSGGIDSSTNTALFSEITSQPVRAFSIGYKGDENFQSYKNEFIYARQVAERYKCDYHELSLTQDDLLGFLPSLIHHQDEPIADPVCVPVYFVSKLARDNGVTVCQVGEGADELFWGYGAWKTRLKMQNMLDFPVPKMFYNPLLFGAELVGRKNSKIYELLRRTAHGERIFWGGAEAFYENEKKSMLSPDLRRKFADISSWDILQTYYKKFKNSAPEPSNLNWMTYLDLKLRLPELLLMRVDKMAMAVSLEGRVPFLDHEFVEYAMSIPSAVKTTNQESKHILKRAVRGLIPDNIIDRKKQGFRVPIYEWFFEELGDFSRTKIAEMNERTGIFDKKFINQLFIEQQGERLWYILNFALWWNEYVG